MSMLATLIVASLTAAQAAHWFVIMAGSNGYANYRHQADTCHAYQIAIKNGIPASNIIHLAYDDIANSNENPFKGKLFNKFTSGEGVDVYEGCKIDYKGKDVNAANFLAVLQGEANATGPVLKSTAEDKVFIYFADHGGPGILGVPMGIGRQNPFIHAADVNSALMAMHQKGMYKELVFYVEACESGSIFANLLKAPNVKAVTAANPTESSWGTYCPPMDMVNGKHLKACLGDQFSVHWMEDTDAHDISKETLLQQIVAVTKLTNKSHVQQYGVTAFDSEDLNQFEGDAPGRLAATFSTVADDSSAVRSRDVPVHIAYWNLQQAQSDEERKEAESKLLTLLQSRKSVDDLFFKIAMAVTDDDAQRAKMMMEGPIEGITKVECHKESLYAVMDHCGDLTDYSMRHSRLFVNLCESNWPVEQILTGIKNVCGKEQLSSPALGGGCSGAEDLPTAPECYSGKAGAFGETETITVAIKSYSAGKGVVDLTGTGVLKMSCVGKDFTKSGQDLTVDLSSCLKKYVEVSSVQYCSDSDTIAVTVKDKNVPVPVSATLKKVACSSSVGELVV